MKSVAGVAKDYVRPVVQTYMPEPDGRQGRTAAVRFLLVGREREYVEIGPAIIVELDKSPRSFQIQMAYVYGARNKGPGIYGQRKTPEGGQGVNRLSPAAAQKHYVRMGRLGFCIALVGVGQQGVIEGDAYRREVTEKIHGHLAEGEFSLNILCRKAVDQFRDRPARKDKLQYEKQSCQGEGRPAQAPDKASKKRFPFLFHHRFRSIRRK